MSRDGETEMVRSVLNSLSTACDIGMSPVLRGGRLRYQGDENPGSGAYDGNEKQTPYAETLC